MIVGIDAIAFDVAKIHLNVTTLAEERSIDPDKLEKGLGLLRMTLPDRHQDVIVFGANALTKLIVDHNIALEDISRIYVGTESGIDNSKPIASFLLELMEQKFGPSRLSECDVVDFTFACIGGVDALQNCIDYIRLNPLKKAIVVTTDIAKYDLESTGEYTQGAGAVAMLITSNPRILSFGNNWGTSTKGVFDFFKPYRKILKNKLTNTEINSDWNGILESEIEIHKDQPVFDGQYSNQCYIDRTRAAFLSYKNKIQPKTPLLDTWHSVIMHLPYSYQGRRMLPEIYLVDSIPNMLNIDRSTNDYTTSLKQLSKSEAYLQFVREKLQPAELASSLIGNLYTGSIFMALLSTLSYYYTKEKELDHHIFGFLAYGSGSKSKVFEGKLQPRWKNSIAKANLFESLEESVAITFQTYEKLHKKELITSIQVPKNEWSLDRIETEIPNLTGARYYLWND